MSANPITLFGFRVPDAFTSGNSQVPITDNPYTTPTTHTCLLTHNYFPSSSTLQQVVGELPRNPAIDRVSSYLIKAGLRARTIEEKETYELSAAILERAARATSTYDIYGVAFAWKYGSTPQRAAEKIAYRRAWMLHSSANKVALPLPPKKPSQSVNEFERKSRGKSA